MLIEKTFYITSLRTNLGERKFIIGKEGLQDSAVACVLFFFCNLFDESKGSLLAKLLPILGWLGWTIGAAWFPKSRQIKTILSTDSGICLIFV